MIWYFMEDLVFQKHCVKRTAVMRIGWCILKRSKRSYGVWLHPLKLHGSSVLTIFSNSIYIAQWSKIYKIVFFIFKDVCFQELGNSVHAQSLKNLWNNTCVTVFVMFDMCWNLLIIIFIFLKLRQVKGLFFS